MDGEGARPAATPRAHGKRQLARCHIEAHTIQRAASPKKKKALDPLRYMPERAAFFALFTVAVQLEDDGSGEPPRRVFRTYKQFRALHSRVSAECADGRWSSGRSHDSRYCRYPRCLDAENVPAIQPAARPALNAQEALRQRLHRAKVSGATLTRDAIFLSNHR